MYIYVLDKIISAVENVRASQRSFAEVTTSAHIT